MAKSKLGVHSAAVIGLAVVAAVAAFLFGRPQRKSNDDLYRDIIGVVEELAPYLPTATHYEIASARSKIGGIWQEQILQMGDQGFEEYGESLSQQMKNHAATIADIPPFDVAHTRQRQLDETVLKLQLSLARLSALTGGGATYRVRADDQESLTRAAAQLKTLLDARK
jgi:hypothetical protein